MVYPRNAGCEAGVDRLSGMFAEGGRNPNNMEEHVTWRKPMEINTDSNLSSGLNQGPWSHEASGGSTDAEALGVKILYGFMKQHLHLEPKA